MFSKSMTMGCILRSNYRIVVQQSVLFLNIRFRTFAVCLFSIGQTSKILITDFPIWIHEMLAHLEISNKMVDIQMIFNWNGSGMEWQLIKSKNAPPPCPSPEASRQFHRIVSKKWWSLPSRGLQNMLQDRGPSGACLESLCRRENEKGEICI